MLFGVRQDPLLSHLHSWQIFSYLLTALHHWYCSKPGMFKLLIVLNILNFRYSLCFEFRSCSHFPYIVYVSLLGLLMPTSGYWITAVSEKQYWLVFFLFDTFPALMIYVCFLRYVLYNYNSKFEVPWLFCCYAYEHLSLFPTLLVTDFVCYLFLNSHFCTSIIG